MSTIEFLSSTKILEVLVICPDFDWVSGTFEIIASFFKTTDDGKHFGVMNFIVPLNNIEHF